MTSMNEAVRELREASEALRNACEPIMTILPTGWEVPETKKSRTLFEMLRASVAERLIGLALAIYPDNESRRALATALSEYFAFVIAYEKRPEKG